jgi:hypothetical protein
VYCKAFTVKTVFSDLYDTYRVTLNELKAVLKASTLSRQTKAPKSKGQQTTQEDGFKKEAWNELLHLMINDFDSFSEEHKEKASEYNLSFLF